MNILEYSIAQAATYLFYRQMKVRYSIEERFFTSDKDKEVLSEAEEVTFLFGLMTLYFFIMRLL